MKYAFWEVQTRLANNDEWENIWTVTDPDGGNERPDIFTTKKDAESELHAHLSEMDAASMDYDRADYRVQLVEIERAQA